MSSFNAVGAPTCSEQYRHCLACAGGWLAHTTCWSRSCQSGAALLAPEWRSASLPCMACLPVNEAEARRYGDVLPRTKLETVVRAALHMIPAAINLLYLPCASLCSFWWLLASPSVLKEGLLLKSQNYKCF